MSLHAPRGPSFSPRSLDSHSPPHPTPSSSWVPVNRRGERQEALGLLRPGGGWRLYSGLGKGSREQGTRGTPTLGTGQREKSGSGDCMPGKGQRGSWGTGDVHARRGHSWGEAVLGSRPPESTSPGPAASHLHPDSRMAQRGCCRTGHSPPTHTPVAQHGLGSTPRAQDSPTSVCPSSKARRPLC